MKGITYCGACADYDIKKHRCKRGAKLENNPQDKFFDDCPLPDAVPVVHGCFVHDGPRFDHGVDWWHCSSCGRLASGAETRFDYCPWCGARMDGGACNQVCKYNTPDRGCVAGEFRERCDLANVAGERGNGEAG